MVSFGVSIYVSIQVIIKVVSHGIHTYFQFINFIKKALLRFILNKKTRYHTHGQGWHSHAKYLIKVEKLTLAAPKIIIKNSILFFSNI